MTRVLLVEDSADVLFIFKIELECLGYQVDALLDAGEALRVAQRTPPDVIVSDLGMPGMDGLEFITRIRQMPRLYAVPAVALTGASLDTQVQRALASGFTAHLTKPVEASELGKRIEQLTAPALQRKAG
jgi:two-component system CheB/CheR fusion protein